MKRIKTILLITATATMGKLHAQDQTFTQLFDGVFQHVSRVDATTGILYNRVIPFSRLYKFSQADTANPEVFMQAYNELYNAAFDSNKRLPFDGNGLENLISNNAAYVDVGILHYRFNMIDTLVAKQKLYFGIDSVLFENQAISASLYNETTILLITPLKEELYNNHVIFRFSPLFQFDNTNNPITNLQVNFGDGNGWQTVGLNSTITVKNNRLTNKNLTV